MKRLYRTLLLLVMAFVMLGTTVFATPASDKEKAENQIKELKIKNHDLFLKVVQEPIVQPKEEPTKEPVASLSELTNKLLGGI